MVRKLLYAAMLVALTAVTTTNAIGPLRKSSLAKELMAAKKDGASKEELRMLHAKLKDEMRVAKAAGVSMETLKKAQLRGATLDEIKRKVNENNLKKRKVKGLFRKKEVTLSSVLFPGVSPNDFQPNQAVEPLVDVLSSLKTQLPIDYYHLAVCKPDDTLYRGKRKNLGEMLSGKINLKRTPYSFQFMKDQSCQVICTEQLDNRQMKRMKKLIQREYTVNLSLDGLPAHVEKTNGSVIRGYPIGSRLINEATEKTGYLIHNHLRFTIEYTNIDTLRGYYRIVGFNVHPVSIAHDPENPSKTCGNEVVRNSEDTLVEIKYDGAKSKKAILPVTYSYEVQWINSETPWTDRWDRFLLGSPDDSSAHHMSVLNSFMIVIFLAACTTIILVKALRKDLALYNEIGIDTGDEEEEAGWKMVHGDVFRPPSYSPMALSVLVGSGTQIACAIIGTLLLSQTSLLNPTMKGQTITNILLLYVFSGSVGGYVSARLFKFSGGKNWKLNTLLTATSFPGTLMCLFIALNVFLSFYGSAKSVSFLTILLTFLLWVCVASPLVFFGSFIGFRQDTVSVPTRTNQIARVVPEQHSFLNSAISSIASGGLPFSCAVIEIYFLMGAIWMHQYYYLMGYLLIIAVLIGITSQLIGVIMCYLRLAGEDHRWWWKAFTDTASVSIWVFVYSLWYLAFRLDLMGVLPVIVYLSYMTMMSVTLGLYCGSVSFLTVFYFNKTIYGAVKID